MKFKVGPKLVTSFAAILLVPTIVVAGFSYSSAKSSVTAEIHNGTVQSIALVNQQISNYIGSREQEVEVLAKQIESRGTSGEILPYLNEYQSVHPELAVTYVGTSTGAFIASPSQNLPAGYDPRQRPWYQQAAAHPGQVILTNPYPSASGGQDVVTIAEMSSDGRKVIAEDLNLGALASVVKQVVIGQSGYVFLTDGNGAYIVDPTHKPGTKATGSEFTAMSQSNSGDVSYTLNGQSNRTIFVTNNLTGWKIGGTMLLSDETKAASPILNATLTVLILAIILGAIVALLTVRSIIKPVRLLILASKTIGGGDLTQEVKIASNDEFGELGESFDYMRESLRAVLADVSNSAHQVAASSEELTAISEESAEASQSVAITIQEVAVGADGQCSSSQKMSKSASEMVAAVQEVSATAQHVSSTAQGAAQVALDGSGNIQTAVLQMESIYETVNRLATVVQSLGERSNEIGNIVDTITSISSQTNLLALNAAIESARAGEAGRGFAVVADEVRKLAEQSVDSAKNISDIIASITSEMRVAIASAVSASQEVENGIKVIHHAGESFNTIKDAVSTVSSQIHDVTVAIDEMAANAEQISISTDEITMIASEASAKTQTVSAATEEQLASMEEIASSANSLSTMAEELQAIVGRFTV